jgi:hypothetical protein
MRRLVLIGLLLAGCGNDGGFSIRSIEVGIGAAIAIGQSGGIAMRAMASTTMVCATVDTQCTTYPCNNGKVTASYGGQCPLPLGTSSGQVTVSGTWQSKDQASLSQVFANAAAGQKNVVVASTSSLSVRRSGGSGSAQITTIDFGGQNATVRGVTALAAQSRWTVVVDDAGTPDDPNDDKYTVDGVDQAAGGTASGQISVDNVVVDPSCRLNPIGGDGTIQSVSTFSVRQERVTFHAACDGKADLRGTTGGTSQVKLNFLAD